MGWRFCLEDELEVACGTVVEVDWRFCLDDEPDVACCTSTAILAGRGEDRTSAYVGVGGRGNSGGGLDGGGSDRIRAYVVGARKGTT